MKMLHEFNVKASTADCYQAITTESGINGWWSKDCNVPQLSGENLTVRFTDYNVEMVFRIDELIPNNKVKWTCVENGNPAFIDTIVEFDFEKTEEGTFLKFNHHNWDSKWKGKPNYEQSKATWEHFLKSLKSYLEKGEGQPW